MPFSSASGKDYIKSLRLAGKRIVDIGAGSGTYKKLFPELSSHWTAVEIWQPYIEKYGLHDLYDEVICADARTIDYTNFDMAFVGDVLEHMTSDDAKALLTNLKSSCRTVIVSIPLGYYPQDEYDNNPYEKHIVDNYSHEQFIELFGKPTEYQIDQEIGVYVYRKLKIAISAISKNESQFVQRFCESAKDADLIQIADTGSTDDTVNVAEECGATVHHICISPWRFDHARNAAIALLPKDIDVVIALDLDEVMEPGWREEIERVWVEGTTRLRYQFDWGAGIRFYYEKIFARHGYHWHHPVHEYPVPDKRIQEVYAHTDKLLVSHYPDPTKSRGQYLPLLRMAVEEDPRCPRNAFYFARELTFYQLWEEAVDRLKYYLNMPEATWVNERGYAMRLLGQAYDHLNQYDEAMAWYRRAVAESPNTREVWVDLAMACYMRKDWESCRYAAKQALNIKDKALVYTCDPAVWGGKPHDLLAIAAWNLGDVETAIEQGQLAVDLEPYDLRLKTNLDHYLAANQDEGKLAVD